MIISSVPSLSKQDPEGAESTILANSDDHVAPIHKKRGNSFLKKKEQMRDRIKNSLFSNSKNTSITCSSSENLLPTTSVTPSLTSASECTVPSVDQNHLLSESSCLSPSNKKVFYRCDSVEDTDATEKDRANGIFKISGNFHNFYELKETLGEGCVGLVKRAERKSDGKVFAVKTVRTRDEETICNIKSEFIHLKTFDHPNIVKVYELYIDNLSGRIHSVMEFIEGKEMFEVIHELGHYSESIASRIFRQIIDAISYMHDNYCCHRDLKPNNILCNHDGTSVKITDFNVSKFSDHYKNYQGGESEIQTGIKMWTYTGTMAFSAPEVFNGDWYDESIDMWSAGCILFTMLSGREPFQAEYVKDLISAICSANYSFEDPVWNDISQEAIDLIKQCLTVNSVDRIKPSLAMSHPFISRRSIDLNNINMFSSNLSNELLNEKTQEDPTSEILLCRRQLSNNLDRLIVNNSKKIRSIKEIESAERPRASSSICGDNVFASGRRNFKNNNLQFLIDSKDPSDYESENQSDQPVFAQDSLPTECSTTKRRKKYSIIFSKEDCFDSLNTLQIPSKPPVYPSCSSSDTSSSPSPPRRSKNFAVKGSIGITPQRKRVPNGRDINLYWDDDESQNYSVKDVKTTNTNPSKEKNMLPSQPTKQITQLLNPSLLVQNKNISSFKQRLVFSKISNPLLEVQQRSFSCEFTSSHELYSLYQDVFVDLLQKSKANQIPQI